MTDIQKLANNLEQAGSRSEKEMTAKLRRHAYESGWPVELGRVLEVKHHENGDFSIQYPAHLEDQILGLEYGTQDIPQNPVMLRTSNRFEFNRHLARISTVLNEVKYI